jgi:hypothetical protein
MKNVAWTISNLTRGKNPPPSFHVVKQFLPSLSHLLDIKDVEVVLEAAWSLSYLSDGTEDHIDAVIGAGVVPKVRECVRSIENVKDRSGSNTFHRPGHMSQMQILSFHLSLVCEDQLSYRVRI